LAENVHSLEWLHKSMERLFKRVQKGSYHADWIDLYLTEAKRKGLREVGIVDHLYRFKETKTYFEKYVDIGLTELGKQQSQWLNQVMTESMGDFVRAITEAKPRWKAEGVTLSLGIEADYFPGGEMELKELLGDYDWDYVIGLVHFMYGWGFDNPETKLLFSNYDLNILYQDFFNVVELAIRSNLFNFIAHLDNLKVFSYRPDESSLLPHYEKIARALIETETATEINAGLYYRYPVKEMCPSPTFLDVLINNGVFFTTSSDSHFPNDIGAFIDLNSQTLLNKGITYIATFEKRNRIMKPLIMKI
jgi:histidinol-phosphatase (PHP family)